jgi:predicted DNA-binding transcriptional regulator YafY
MQRCLALLRRLQRGSASKKELIAVALAEIPEVYGDLTDQRALDKRFEADKKRLFNWFGVKLHYRRADHTYEIEDVWNTPLLNLSDQALQALAFLQTTFSPTAPQSEQVQNFLSLLQSYLPSDRQKTLLQQRTALEVEWGQRDRDHIDPQVEQDLNRARLERRLIAFDYHSPRHTEQQARRHTVEPWQQTFDSIRGHYYLRGYCRRVSGPKGEFHPNRYFLYRLGRIHNLEILPQKLPPSPPLVPKVKFTYRLAPAIARLGDVTTHPGITIEKTEPQPDGSIVVQAHTTDPWWTVRSLLHYGSNCQILSGNEVLYEMHRTVKAMAQVYELIEENE